MPVYFIRAGKTGPVKIGHAADPHGRLRELQGANHTYLKIIRIMKGGVILEKQLHKRFGAQHMRGEWFRFSRKMLNEDFKSIRVFLRDVAKKEAARKKEFEKEAKKIGKFNPGHGRIFTLCAKAGIAPSTFWRWRAGKNKPHPRTLTALRLAAQYATKSKPTIADQDNP